MSTQPEALQLAEAMSFAFPGNLGIDKAAAELRRLHAENKLLHDRHHDGNVILTQMLAQRDALLEALRLMMDCAGDIATAPDSMLEMALTDGDEETRRQAKAFLVARAAIKTAEETK